MLDRLALAHLLSSDLYVVDMTFVGRDEQVFFSCSKDDAIPSDTRWSRDHCAIQSMPPDGFKCVEAVYSSNETSIVSRMAKTNANYHVPISRGYHTAVIVQLDGQDQLLVWGGLHARRPTGRLELLNLTHNIERDGDRSPWTIGIHSPNTIDRPYYLLVSTCDQGSTVAWNPALGSAIAASC